MCGVDLKHYYISLSLRKAILQQVVSMKMIVAINVNTGVTAQFGIHTYYLLSKKDNCLVLYYILLGMK